MRIARGEQESAACRITIVVSAGTYPGSVAASTDPAFERFPLIIDVPDITLQGAFDMQIDATAAPWKRAEMGILLFWRHRRPS